MHRPVAQDHHFISSFKGNPFFGLFSQSVGIVTVIYKLETAPELPPLIPLLSTDKGEYISYKLADIRERGRPMKTNKQKDKGAAQPEQTIRLRGWLPCALFNTIAHIESAVHIAKVRLLEFVLLK